MKTNALLRAACCAVIVLLIGGFLLFMLSGDAFRYEQLTTLVKGTVEARADFYTGSAGIDAEGIDAISILWRSGSVDIRVDGEDISFTETSADSIGEDDKLRYRVIGSTLVIEYLTDGLLSGTTNVIDKNLSLTLPRDLMPSLTSLTVESTNGGITLSGIRAEEVEISSVSGDIAVTGLSCSSLRLHNVSGTLTCLDTEAAAVASSTLGGPTLLFGSFGRVDCESISGKLKVSSLICPDELRLSSISGPVTLLIPEDSGFSLSHISVSGGFDCPLPITYENGKAVLGDGAAAFDIQTVVGSISVAGLDG